MYYLARQISAQKGTVTVFTGDDYGSIKKCYSIWLCPDTGKKRRSGISFLDLSMSKIFGCLKFHRTSYDLMAAVFCSFRPGEEGHELLKFFDTLLSQEKSLAERRKILEEKFGLHDREMEGV